MYITEYPNALDEEFCNHLIEKFDKDPRKVDGVVGGGYNPKIKKSVDLHISTIGGYEKEDRVLFESLNPRLEKYLEEHWGSISHFAKDITDSGYQIQKTVPGGFYSWHHDGMIQDHGTRLREVTYIWYLNTVTEGGETEFKTGERIKPEAGKLLLFPAVWPYGHRGVTPISGDKYICTGWVYSRVISYD
jgi:hypothetical protein